MKKIQNIALAATMVPVLLFSSCSNDYLDRTPTTAMDTEIVLNDPSLVPTTVVGTMKMMWAYSTWGCYIPVLGDLMTDMVTSIRANQGTLQDMERWNITTNSTDAATFWAGPYQVAAAAARTIEASKRMLADSANLQLDASETNNLYSALATSLTIKVHAEYFLSQFFCIDVNETDVPGSNPTKVGLILLHDRALTNTEPANMSTLEATYQLMEKEIAEAIDAFGRSGSSSFTLQSGEARYYPTLAAAYMVQARVLLAQGRSNPTKYEAAYNAAQNALDNLPSGANGTLISTEEGLLNAYGETPSSEDIWLLEYTSQDNLSANSLNSIFGSYGFTPTEKATDLFESGDIRRALYANNTESAPSTSSSSYCLKYPTDNYVFNVPVLRVPELYLIQAECMAMGSISGGGVSAARDLIKNNILAARDTAMTDDNFNSRYPDLASDEVLSGYDNNGVAQGFLRGLLDEHARELLCEGQRWSILRRNGVALNRMENEERGTVGSGNDEDSRKFRTHFQAYPLSRVSLPVPFTEFNTQQWKAGRAVDFDGNIIDPAKNWQTNAWDQPNGSNNYSPNVALPEDGESYNNKN